MHRTIALLALLAAPAAAQELVPVDITVDYRPEYQFNRVTAPAMRISCAPDGEARSLPYDRSGRTGNDTNFAVTIFANDRYGSTFRLKTVCVVGRVIVDGRIEQVCRDGGLGWLEPWRPCRPDEPQRDIRETGLTSIRVVFITPCRLAGDGCYTDVDTRTNLAIRSVTALQPPFQVDPTTQGT